jgi:hypothetical protein
MYKVSESLLARDSRIRAFLETAPELALILAFVNLEWLIRRAILSLSNRPNREVQEIMRKNRPSGLQGYKEMWKEVVSSDGNHAGLTAIITNWSELLSAAHLRNKLMHGIYSCGPDYARRKTAIVQRATEALVLYCQALDVDLCSRLRVRRSKFLVGG